jgi:hypothetical protein
MTFSFVARIRCNRAQRNNGGDAKANISDEGVGDTFGLVVSGSGNHLL